MAGPTTATVTAVSGAAAFMSLMPFGVSLTTLFIGGACFFAGSCARTGLALIRKLDGNDSINGALFIRQIAILLCTMPLAAVASCIVFLAAHVLGVEADAAFGGLLLIMGVRGPEGFTWLMNTFMDVFTKFAPGGKSGQP